MILISMGARYKGYCANLSRSILVNPTAGQRKAYETLLALRERLIALFKPGKRIGDIHKEAKEYLAAEAPDLLPKFVKNCGSGMGIVFRERCFLMTSKNDRLMREGMTFNLSIGAYPPFPSSKWRSFLLKMCVLGQGLTSWSWTARRATRSRRSTPSSCPTPSSSAPQPTHRRRS